MGSNSPAGPTGMDVPVRGSFYHPVIGVPIVKNVCEDLMRALKF